MTWEQFQIWLQPATILALIIVVAWVGRTINARLYRLEDAVNRDMRYYGERMMRVETFLKLPPLPPSQ